MSPDAAAPPPAAGATRLRLRAQLLEFLKFRVLAAQDAFFADLGFPGPEGVDPGPIVQRLRCWLREWGAAQFEALGDADLLAVLDTARYLYTD